MEGYEHTNYLVHIYVTYANSVIQDAVLNNKKNAISRAKIERDIIRLIHQNEILSLDFKIACTSMILHTGIFDSFWYGCKMSAELSARSIKRMKPDYSLVEEIPCPEETDSAATGIDITLSTLDVSDSNGVVNGTVEDIEDDKNNNNNNININIASITEATNGKKSARKKGRKRQPPKRRAPPKSKTQRANADPGQQTKTKTAAPSKPLPKTVAQPTKAVKEITPPATTLQLQKRTKRPVGPNPREAYELCMSRSTGEDYGGPSSASESAADDDDSSDFEK